MELLNYDPCVVRYTKLKFGLTLCRVQRFMPCIAEAFARRIEVKQKEPGFRLW
jgi:hypothetical protein